MTTKKTTDNTFPAFDFSALMDAFKAPNFDASELVEAHKKNVEALAKANRAAVEGFKAVAARQAEIVKDEVANISEVTGEVLSGKTPEANASKQFELAQNAFTRSWDYARELSELTLKVNQQVFDVLQTRVDTGVEEVKTQAKQAAK